jgi:acyl transferase domain-containing protein
VGVFAGMHNATYGQHHVSAHPQRVQMLGEFQVMLGNEKDYIATRTAHRLNLTGPAISVQTACSTSLVAVVQAVDSLRDGRCSMALAGGASVTCPPRSGYLYNEGAMLSPDGHTRSFDAEGQGTVFSDGVAAVLLKRLSDAIADGDAIHAVIRGAAINNDGGDKASFTAPSVDGQAAVIAAALDDAGVDAGAIGYVEAHGTATPLGDPVEVEALTRAFRRHTDARGFCRLGSVKSHLGHTVIAAGVTGLIKAVLALEKQHIPANANFSSPNPKIGFEASPFVVASTPSDWHRGPVPRLAGVSSFGVGGTNAHAVLEEAPEAVAAPPNPAPQVLRLAARTPAALEQQAARLAVHLDADPELDLCDAAFTLRTGRGAFVHRLVVVARTAAEAAATLRTKDAKLRSARALPAQSPALSFVFPGQGAQYAGMGQALYQSLPEFREAFDRCAEAVRHATGVDLRTAVFNGDADALKATSLTQPATFALEYALASFWIARGAVPKMLIGHSVGEFVAAALAGVLPAEDAARLVALRGRLMEDLPAGSMLSVRAPAERVAGWLPTGLTIAADNAPNLCVVAGPTQAVEALRAQLERDGVITSLLQTSHAFHSAMMEPAIGPFEAAVRRVKLAPPQIPIISTLTGALLGDAEATDPHYWARHLRATVRFSPAIRVAMDALDTTFLEVGPRATLSTLIRQHGAVGRQPPLAIPSLGATAADELGTVALAIGQLWTQGIDVPWFDAGERRRRVRLPTYPFERVRCWVDTQPKFTSATAGGVPSATAASVHPFPPAALPAPSGTPCETVSIEALFQQQIELMTQQLALLRGADFSLGGGAESAEGNPATRSG